MDDQVAHHRHQHAGAADDKQAAAAEETGRDHYYDGVQDRDRRLQRRERIDEEDRDGRQEGDCLVGPAEGLQLGQRLGLHCRCSHP